MLAGALQDARSHINLQVNIFCTIVTMKLIDLLSERAAFGQAALATSWGR